MRQQETTATIEVPMERTGRLVTGQPYGWETEGAFVVEQWNGPSVPFGEEAFPTDWVIPDPRRAPRDGS